MKKFHWLVVVLFTFSSVAFGQDKLLTLDDIFSPDTKVRVRFSGMPTFVTWSADGKSFRQVVNGKLMRVDAMTGQAVPYYDTVSLINALMRVGVKAEDANALANSPALHFNEDESAILINNANDLWHYEIGARALRRLTNGKTEEKEEDFSPDGKWVSFVRGNDLYIVDIAKGSEKQLTRDGREGDKAIYNGYLDWIYEEELYGRGQKCGYWWSPDSKRIAFLRLDESPVPKFIIPNDIPTDQEIETTFYPQAGDPNPLVRLGIADVNKTPLVPNAGRIPKLGQKLPPAMLRVGDSVKFVDTSIYKPEDLLIARVAWAPDSKVVTFQALNREQTYLDLNTADLNGKIKKFLTENSPAWVEVYDNPIFLQNGKGIWLSARTGWKHLFLYNSSGEMEQQLTGGRWEVRNVYGVDEKGGWIYFSATMDSHIAEQVYRVSTSGGPVEKVTSGDGTHTATFNKTFSHFVDISSDVNTPPQTRLRKADGTTERIINENKVEALSKYKLSKPEFMLVKTRDNFEMEAMMIKPPDFDPSKKYPVFQYTYSGPHAPSVANRWMGSRGMWFHMLAQKGYIVWVCDNRSAERQRRRIRLACLQKSRPARTSRSRRRRELSQVFALC